MSRAKGLFILLALIVTITFSWLFGANRIFYNGFYVETVYRAIRWILSRATSIISWPLIYILVPVYLGSLTWYLGKALTSKHRRALKFLSVAVAQVILLVVAFQWLWGFNYKRTLSFGVVDEMEKPDAAFIYAEADRLIVRLDSLAKLIEDKPWPQLNSRAIDRSVREVLDRHGVRTWSDAQCKPLGPPGILYRIQTSGFFMPYLGESYIDDAMLFFQRPFVTAHELSHAHGIGDEGLCNFIAWLACHNSGDQFMEYSASFAYMLYLFSDIRKLSENDFEQYINSLDPYSRKNIELRRALFDRYPAFFPQIRDMIYNAYLRSQGVESGLDSYDELVTRIYDWKRNSLDRYHTGEMVLPGSR